MPYANALNNVISELDSTWLFCALPCHATVEQTGENLRKQTWTNTKITKIKTHKKRTCPREGLPAHRGNTAVSPALLGCPCASLPMPKRVCKEIWNEEL